MKTFLKFLTIFTISYAAPVKIVQVKIECRQEVTLKIECFLPTGNEREEFVEIFSSAPLQSSLLSDEQIQNARDVELNPLNMPEHMPFSIGSEFQHLRALWIVRSQLRVISRDSFKKMNGLRALNLYENKIDSLSPDVFYDLLNLEFLDLDDNEIVELNSHLFVYMPELTIIRMRSNKLEIIDENLFKHNKKLQEIHLNNNKLKKIGVDFFKMENLLAVNLEGNYGECDLSVGFWEDWEEKNGRDETLEERNERMMRIFQRDVEMKCR